MAVRIVAVGDARAAAGAVHCGRTLRARIATRCQQQSIGTEGDADADADANAGAASSYKRAFAASVDNPRP
ncbi:hypothetical protein ACTJKJ_12595 [Roseateles sp. 22389]|uniref:hypothetical protein n=1 Tax=Roseateles sp. 22389 TaxID=3453916 RepID=UPI003F8589DB